MKEPVMHRISTKLRSHLLVALFVLGIPSVALAECRVLDDGKSILIGKFPFANAYRDCLRVYKNHYLRKDNDGDSTLQLRCKGAAQEIAFVRDGRYFETGMRLAGCALPKTMG